MDFGLFFLIQRDEAWTEQAVYDSALEQMLAAEGLGYHSAWIAEHHFNDYLFVDEDGELCVGHGARWTGSVGRMRAPAEARAAAPAGERSTTRRRRRSSARPGPRRPATATP